MGNECQVDRPIARLREEKGFTQERLAKLAGTTGGYIDALEKGKPGRIATLARIAAVLAVPLERLYED